MKEIYKKIQAFAKEKPSLLRDTKADNYKYATLDQIQGKINPILEKLWLIVIHKIIDNKVVSQLIDVESGELIQSEIEINTTKPQDKGSEITYYRRYNLVSLLDLEVEDDDGKKAQDSRRIFWEKEFSNLKAKKDEYVDAISVLWLLSEKWYEWTKEMEDKIVNLFK